jgi:hypothetical protein
MFFKDCTLLALLLFITIIVFAFLSYHKQIELMTSIKEGNTNMDDETDDVPTCGNNDAPGCYNTVLDYDVYHYDPTSMTAMNDDNYILKTQIVPPVCPSCPTSLIDHQHGELNEQYDISGEIPNEFSNNNTSVTNINEIEQTSVSNNENTSTTNNNQQMSNVYNVTNNTSYGENDNKSGQNNNVSGSILGGRNNSQNNGNTIQEYQNEINRLKGEISKLKQGRSGSSDNNGECPPCPACERCPEPAFTCEKVINYRSPNVGEYLPLPVLNDFSTF